MNSSWARFIFLKSTMEGNNANLDQHYIALAAAAGSFMNPVLLQRSIFGHNKSTATYIHPDFDLSDFIYLHTFVHNTEFVCP